MKKLILCIPVFFLACFIHAQMMMNKDSLLRLLPSAKEDTTSVFLYINLGQQYESSEPELAKHYYRKAGELSRKINFPLGEIKFIANYTYVLNLQGLYDSSLYYNLQSVELSKQINDSSYLAKTIFNTGTSYRVLGQYENAVKFYVEGQKLFGKINQPDAEALVFDLLQTLYCDMHQYERAVEYGEKAVALVRKLGNDESSLAVYLSNLGNSYGYINQYKKALDVYQESLALSRKSDNRYAAATQLLNIGDAYLHLGEYEKMKPVYDESLKESKQLDSKENVVIALRGLSLYHQYKKQFGVAKQYIEEALEISLKENFDKQRVFLLGNYSNIAFAMGDVEMGYQYSRKRDVLQDSLLNKSVQDKTVELEKKFETEQKDLRIKQLEGEKKIQQLTIGRKNTLNYVLIGSAITILLISLLSYRNYKQKQKLQQQRIAELETEKQLAATEAVLKGEEQERTRLAKDLHDGLGGMLSGIKYSLNTMKGNLIMTPDNAQAFERSMDMLDSSIKEMRRVAHNMMPEALVKFGLDTALKDFCNDINQSGALKVNYQSIGLENTKIEQTTAITIYRIVQELLHNTTKHAAAKTAIVQVSKTNGVLSVEVEDDGKGFDTLILKQSKGIGWHNIQNRIEFLKGKLNVNSQAGKGTSVHIELYS
jgi:two-component system, NarL family, sensor kinase